MIKGYYFITDSDLSRLGNEGDVRLAVKAGVSVIQYRNKNASEKELLDEALRLRKICDGINFIVNDRIDIALACGADGVHLGQDDMPLSCALKILGKNKIIGVTVHNVEEAREAETGGAGYLAISPIFATSTKKDAGSSCGIGLIREIRKISKLPLVAIGGITLENASEVIKAGAGAICAISAVVAAADPLVQMKKFQKLFEWKSTL